MNDLSCKLFAESSDLAAGMRRNNGDTGETKRHTVDQSFRQAENAVTRID